MFGRRPAVAVIVDIQLDAVAIGILIVEGSLGARISAQDRRDAYSFQTRIGAEQVIKAAIFKGKVLKPLMLRSVGILPP